MLHWLVSESLFLAHTTLFVKSGQQDPQNSISTVGYSCIPILIVIILSSITMLLGLLHGFRRCKPGMTFAGSCTAAISAAYHPPEGDVGVSKKHVLWGVVSSAKEDDVGHCSSASLEATAPAEGGKI